MALKLQHGDSLYQVIEKVNSLLDGTVKPGSAGPSGASNSTVEMISTEINRATAAEQYLQEQINILGEKVGVDEDGNPVAEVNSETDELQGALIMESIYAATREDENTTSIAAEVARATAAEQALDTRITDEVTRAITAEQALDTRITDEVTRATAAEQNLQDQIDAINISGLQQAIDNEVTRARQAEQNLQNEIDNITPVKETYSATLNGQKGSTWIVTAERYNGIVTMLVSYRLGSGQTSTAGETISTTDLLPAHWRPGIFQTVMCAMMANQTQYMFSMQFNTNGRIDFINGSSGTSGTWGAISASLTFIAGDI